MLIVRAQVCKIDYAEVNHMAIQFSVMTWNVENLFPPGTFISPSSELIDHIMVSKGLLLRGADFIVKEVRSFVN